MTYETKLDGYKDYKLFEAALAAAGVEYLGSTMARGALNWNAVVTANEPDSGTLAKINAAHAGVGLWTLSADGTDGSVDITVSGADAACDWSVELEGVEIASEADTAAPYQVVLTAPVEAGTYTIKAVASDGTATGQIQIEVT